MDERIIAVMGATGAGKSSLIRLVTENSEVAVGHGLTSETQNITAYNFNFIGYNIVLVDTPGFDDTYRSDRDILQSLVEWLTRIYKEGTKLSGILYLHRITDVRMQGSATRNLRVFRDLCGEACFSNVLLCTTFWDTAAETESSLEARLTELCQNEEFWGGMIANGSRVCKGPVTRAAAISMIYELIGCPKATLKVQKEIVDEYKPLNESSAVSALMNLELERQKQGHEARLATERKVFEDMLRLKDRKTSEDMESMRKVFDQKLADLDQTNKKLLEDLGEIEKVSRKPNMSAANEAPEYKRAITFAAGDQSAMDEMVRRRRQRYANFANYLKATTELLENEKRYGRVKIDFFSRKSCYTIVCTNCLKNIGSSECYKCVECSTESPFILCTRCYYNNSVICDNPSHSKQNMSRGKPATVGVQCPRVNCPPQDAPLFCSKCSQNVGRCYVHCCACSEAWDMCIKCAMKGKHCPGHRRAFPFSPHKLEICARYVDM